MRRAIVTAGLAMMMTTNGAAATAADLEGLADARGIAADQIETSEVHGRGDCPVVLSVDRGLAGPGSARGAARLPGGWVLGGDQGALLQTLDHCARDDSNPSQLAAIAAAMAGEAPLTPILTNENGLIRDKLADAGRAYLPPQSENRNGAVIVEFQALVGDSAAPALARLVWTPGKAAAVEVERY